MKGSRTHSNAFTCAYIPDASSVILSDQKQFIFVYKIKIYLYLEVSLPRLQVFVLHRKVLNISKKISEIKEYFMIS